MTSISSATRNGLKQANTANRSIRKWFWLYALALIIWVGLYIFSHSCLGIQGYELSRFSSADIRHINSILINGNINNTAATTTQHYSTTKKQPVNNTNDGFLDTPATDSSAPVKTIEYPQIGTAGFINEDEIKKRRARLAMTYISSQYGSEISTAELVNIERYLSTFTPRETGIFLADYKLRLSSFFWLNGIYAYAEVIFWVVFGVFCSLLFYTGHALRKGNGYHQRDVLYQSTRLFFAPFAAIIVSLGYTYMKGGSTMNTEWGEGMLILAFLLGLSSGVALELLDRFRSNRPALHPAGEMPEDTPPARQYAPEIEKHPAPSTFIQKPVVTQAPPKKEQPENEYLAQDESAQKPNRTSAGDDNEIPEVAIDLKLDFSGLFDDERTQLQRIGFSKAIVTLHNVNGKDIIPARKQKSDMTIFIATDVKPGIYIARATLSQRLRDDQIMNLFGEKTAYITEDKPGLELFVKKYEAAD